MTAALDHLLAQLGATSAPEAGAVLLGLAYSALAVWRSRWCWVCGGLSSLVLVYLAARAGLPMQAALQVYYVAVSIYGFRRWQQQRDSPIAVSTWPLRSHLIALLAIIGVSAVSAHWLSAETGAAWPFLDSLTTWASLLATWLVVSMKLENWLYWIAIDSVLVFLFAAQSLPSVALLYLMYLAIAAAGYVTWRRALQRHAL